MHVLSNNHRVLFVLDKFSPMALRRSLEQLPEKPESPVGILRIGNEERGSVLFVLQGDPFAAATYESGELRLLTVEEFGRQVDSAQGGASFFGTNPVFFKLMLVLAKCQPSVVGNGQVINLETLLESIERAGKEQVLLLKKGKDLNLFYFRDGKLVEGYFADPERNPSDTSGLAEALLLYAFEPGAPLEIRLYEDPRVDQEPSPAAAGLGAPGREAAFPSVEIRSKGRQVQKRIEKEIFTIGRGNQNDFMIDDSSVSREHARILRSAEGYFIEDLKSRNGTYMDGRRIVKEKLSDGSEVRIGAIDMRFTLPNPSDSFRGPDEQTKQIDLPPAAPALPKESWTLEILEGNDKGGTFSLQPGKKMSVGRATVDILINDPKISRHHADIEWIGGGFVFQDLQSKNGSFINEQPVGQCKLKAGDILRLGETVLKVACKR